MIPDQYRAAAQEKSTAFSDPPLNLWKQLEPQQQKVLAQRWGQLLRRIQLTKDPDLEGHDVDD